MAQNISVPDIGDFKDVEVIEVLVKPGDQINKNDPIVTIESDKSSLEIPSPSNHCGWRFSLMSWTLPLLWTTVRSICMFSEFHVHDLKVT